MCGCFVNRMLLEICVNIDLVKSSNELVATVTLSIFLSVIVNCLLQVSLRLSFVTKLQIMMIRWVGCACIASETDIKEVA